MTEPSAPGWRRAVAPLLLASLMVNMFLIGGVVGDRFAPDPPPAPVPPVDLAAPERAPSERPPSERPPSERPPSERPLPESGAPRARAAAIPFRDAIAQLPIEERRIVNAGFLQRRQETRVARDRVIAARGRARELMAADPLDATALSTALTEMRAASTALQNVTHAVLLETAPRLGAESRRKLADALRAQ